MIRLHTLGSIGLRDHDDRDIRPVLAQSRRFAVLAALATSPNGQCHREQLVGLFWPDRAAPLAHVALRQAIRFLRRELDPEAIANIGSRILVLDPAIVTCDASEFTQACAGRDYERALQIYQGDFLDGLFIADASREFDDWRERECSHLRRLALDAASALISLHRNCREPAVAIYWSRRALVIEPDNESMLRQCMTLLSDTGDHASAIRAYESFRAHLGRDLGGEPSATTEDLMAAIRMDQPLVLFPPPQAVDNPQCTLPWRRS